jgi:uncharacterized membrane protein
VIRLEFLYVLMGALAAGVAIVNLRDRASPRSGRNALFWGLYAASFLVGSYIGDLANGCIALAMVVVASFGLGRPREDESERAEREAGARRWGNRLFIPALIIPVVTLLGTMTLGRIRIGGAPLVDPKQVTLVALGLATLAALVVGMLMLRAPLAAPMREARRLWDAVGWAAVLPQMLATLGALFAAAGVGQVVSTLLGRVIPLDQAPVAVVAYTLGMAIFTMVMGNAFAAFPVMTAAIGLPVLVHRFGGDPAIVSAIGMLSGFCGTLMTPMAANFNIVPVALLELPDEHAVIKAQIPTAIPLLAVNTVLMYLFLFH